MFDDLTIANTILCSVNILLEAKKKNIFKIKKKNNDNFIYLKNIM